MVGTSGRDISICVAIPTYQRESVLVDTITQVLAQSPAADEVLVVDQTPTHEEATGRALEEWSSQGRIRWIRQETPCLPMARNRALRESRCEIVVFIDDDVRLSEGYVGFHARNYLDERTAAVAGRCIQPRGWRLRKKASWPRVLDFNHFPLDGEQRVEGIANFPGGNHSVRRLRAMEMGGYDENFIGWAFREDSDMAIRIWKSGGLIVFDPEASLVHLAAPSGGCSKRATPGKHPEWVLAFPRLYFAWKHLFPSAAFWHEAFVRGARRHVFTRANMLHPWRLPRSAASWSYSFVRAAALARRSRK